jgi:hypothetical protein
MESLYLQLKNLGGSRWDISHEKDKKLIKIAQGENVVYRVYPNIHSPYTFFLLGDNSYATPLNEFFILDFMKNILR